MSVVVTSGLTRRFGPITAVNQLSVELPDAGVIGLVGPNGSGKSTLIRMLLGLVRPTHGSAMVFGEPISSPARYVSRVGGSGGGAGIRPGSVGASQPCVSSPVAGSGVGPS